MEKVLKLMKDSEALLEGHFLLSSGRHSGRYCQCAKLLSHPRMAEQALSEVAIAIKDKGITKVCGPAMGGIIVAYELARQIGCEAIFTERKDDEMQLRRGFSVDSSDRIIIAEDVVTTGKSSMETINVLKALGAEVIGIACIVDRRSDDCILDLPIYSALKLEIPSYTEGECPICIEGIPLVKPGSRKNIGK